MELLADQQTTRGLLRYAKKYTTWCLQLSDNWHSLPNTCWILCGKSIDVL